MSIFKNNIKLLESRSNVDLLTQTEILKRTKSTNIFNWFLNECAKNKNIPSKRIISLLETYNKHNIHFKIVFRQRLFVQKNSHVIKHHVCRH